MIIFYYSVTIFSQVLGFFLISQIVLVTAHPHNPESDRWDMCFMARVNKGYKSIGTDLMTDVVTGVVPGPVLLHDGRGLMHRLLQHLQDDDLGVQQPGDQQGQ